MGPSSKSPEPLFRKDGLLADQEVQIIVPVRQHPLMTDRHTRPPPGGPVQKTIVPD